MNECISLDTNVINKVIRSKDEIIMEFNQLSADYNNIVNELLKNWDGKGASEFRESAVNMKENIGSINSILHEMCDVLIDCREIIEDCDIEIGDFNASINDQTKEG